MFEQTLILLRMQITWFIHWRWSLFLTMKVTL